MKKFREILALILFLTGVLTVIFSPIYQLVEMKINNVPGDGEEVYGDNLFKKILGVKIIKYTNFDGNWDYSGATVMVAPWMQKVSGLPEKVTWSSPYEENSKGSDIFFVIFLRLFIKCIPFVLILIGYFLSSKKQT
jgi:hypothetical protein